MNIIKKFKCKDGVYFSVDIDYGKTSGVIKTRNDKNWICSTPDSRETINQETIFYENDINIPEIVDAFEICYGLSMLSRYFPDIWVGFLESHCKGSKLIEVLITILTSKIPILILNQMTGTQYTISTLRPYWHQG